MNFKHFHSTFLFNFLVLV